MRLTRRNLLAGAGLAAAGAVMPTVGAREVSGRPKWDRETDVLVVGYGGAGAAAAITAHDAGAKVLILEKMPRAGGNTAVSFGSSVNVDDVEKAYEYFKDVYQLAETPHDDELLRAYVNEASHNKEFLESLKPGEAIRTTGKGSYLECRNPDSISKWVFRAPRGKTVNGGEMLFANYRYAVEEARKIPVLLNTRGLQLITRNGEIIGLEAESEGKKILIKAARAVILTTGGFEYNDWLLANYVPGTKFKRLGNPGNTGDGLLMAESAGAFMWHMPFLSCPLGAVVPGKTAAIQVNVIAPSHFFVDADGKRFMNEKVEHHISINCVNFFDPIEMRYPRIPCYAIMDQAALDYGPLSSTGSGYMHNREGYTWSKDNRAEVESGVIVKADTIKELAEKIKVPADNLMETFKRWNKNIAGKKDPDFGRLVEKEVKGNLSYDAPVVSRPLSKKGPYYALALWPAMLNTQGGPKRNAKAQLVTPFGQPIRRLYAAGELGSIWGVVYQGAGNNSEAMTFGRIAGRNAAAEKPWS